METETIKVKTTYVLEATGPDELIKEITVLLGAGAFDRCTGVTAKIKVETTLQNR